MQEDQKYECDKCGKAFCDNANLRRHKSRKTPCQPILENNTADVSGNGCRYCGRQFASSSSMYRHVRQYCKIANSDEGMEKLFNHTIQRQLARLEAQNTALQDQVSELAILMRQQSLQQLTISDGTPLTLIQHQTNIGIQQNVQVNTTIIGFDREDRIYIPIALVKAAFTENPRLIEYCRMTDNERTNADKAAPYVLEALVDLVRRAHKDPMYRNIYLNPKRADQVMVCVEEKEDKPKNIAQRWEVRSLVDAIRLLFDGVAENLHRMIITEQERSQLPFDIQSAAAWVPNLYTDEPDRFVQDGKAPMSAHFANTSPTVNK